MSKILSICTTVKAKDLLPQPLDLIKTDHLKLSLINNARNLILSTFPELVFVVLETASPAAVLNLVCWALMPPGEA